MDSDQELKTHKMYLLLEVDTWEPDYAAGTYPGIGGHALVNRLRDCTANGKGMFERLMIRVLAAQNVGSETLHYSGGEVKGNIMIDWAFTTDEIKRMNDEAREAYEKNKHRFL